MRKYFFGSVPKMSAILPMRTMRSLSKQRSLLPFYHTVSDKPLAHIEQLYAFKNTKEFISDLDFFTKYFEPLSLSDFVAAEQGLTLRHKPYFHLSFDDGLSQCHDVIAPILLSKAIPATFFLVKNFVTQEESFYRFKASLLCSRLPELNSNLLSEVEQFLKIKSRFVLTIKESILKISFHQRQMLDELAAIMNIDTQAYFAQNAAFMNMDQIIDLQNNGFSLGAHSINHPRFGILTKEEQLEQISGSVAFVKQAFSVPEAAFAFPYDDRNLASGLLDSFPKQLLFGTSGFKKMSNPYHFQRISFENPNFSAKDILLTEYAYYLCKKWVGK